MLDRVKWCRRRYLLLAVTILITVIGVSAIHSGLSDMIAENDIKMLKQSASIVTTSINDFMQEHISDLEDTAALLEPNVFKNEGMTKHLLQSRPKMFASYSLFSPSGEKIFDVSETSFTLTLQQSAYLNTLLEDKKTVVLGSSTSDAEHTKYAVICTPVLHNGEVSAILTGTIPMTIFNEWMTKWEEQGEGCAFLITERGTYLTDGERLNTMIKEESGDFITYIDHNSVVQGKNSKNFVLGQIMQNREEISLQYKYDKKHFIAQLVPVTDTEWYFVCVKEEQGFSLSLLQFHGITAGIIVVMMTLWGILVVHWSILVFQSGKEKEQLKRFQTISTLDRSILFELRFSTSKKLRLFGDVQSAFGVDKNYFLGESVYDVYDRFHPEDVSVRKRIHQFFEDDEEVFTAEVRIQVEEGRYGWFRIIGTMIQNPHTGENFKFVGKVENADEEIADEKNLMERAENDLLTGVLNKKTMEDRVVQSLIEIPSSTYRIFFMVDLDNFKNVNDKLGHIMGDKAIVDTANVLTKIFPTEAFVGRLGGDEFAVCASYQSFDEESLYKFIRKKADQICESNRRTYTAGDFSVNISSSVGIAVAPTVASSFEELYQKADNALYQSKNGGKNCYHIYGIEK